MWLDDHTGSGPHQVRAREAVATGATVVATACPFCLNMLSDGLKHEHKDMQIRTRDIAEIVADRVVGCR